MKARLEPAVRGGLAGPDDDAACRPVTSLASFERNIARTDGPASLARSSQI